MARFKFTGQYIKAYPAIKVPRLDGTLKPLVAAPGQTYDLDADPGDGLWKAEAPVVAAPAPVPSVAPVAPVAPSAPVAAAPTESLVEKIEHEVVEAVEHVIEEAVEKIAGEQS